MKLTVDEMEAIQKELNRRFKINKNANLINIGFGPALKRGRRDKERPMAVCFMVKKKKAEVGKERYPDAVTIDPKKGGLTRSITLPTDVVEVKGTARKTGEEIQFGSGKATTGAVVAWRIRNDAQEHWGVLTVAHLMPAGVASVSGAGDIATVHGPHGDFHGSIRIKSSRQSGLDVALLEVSKDALLDNELMTPAEAATRDFVRSADTLIHDGGARGETFSKFGTRALIVERFHPTYHVSDLGTLIHIVEAKNHWAARTFRAGSSGAAWQVERESACMQVAGLDRTADPYEVGFGQALSTILKWIRGELESRVALVANSFRLIATF